MILRCFFKFCLLLVNIALLNAAAAADDNAQVDNGLQDFIRPTERRLLGVEFFEYVQENLTLTERARLDIESLKCLNELRLLSAGVTSGSLWAWKFIDAWGGIPSGILYGNFHDLGNFDECLSIDKEITQNRLTTRIKGQYCLAKLPFDVQLVKYARTAICMPASCSAATVNPLLRNFFNSKLHLGLASDFAMISAKSCQTNENSPLGGTAIFTIVLISIFTVIVIASGVYDYLFVKNSGQMHPLLRCLSLRANSRDLFSTVDQSKKPNVITALNGMRCLSLVWVVFGHDYIMGALSPNINDLGLYYWMYKPFSMLIEHAQFSVDTFFFISGLLIVMVVMRGMERRKGKLNVPLMYLHRYLRLTPLLGIAILVYVTVLPHLGKAPLWGTLIFDNYDNCKKHWWETLLYVQNYAAHNNMCINHSWYLAVDMQLYLISPIFLFALYKWGKKALAGIIIFTLLLSAYTFTIIAMGKYSLFFKHNEPDDSQYHLYFATHNHAVPWLVGFIFGYILHISREKPINLSMFTVWLGWLIALATMFTSLFALYPKMQRNAPPLTPLEDAFYTVFTRAGWPLALCWVVFACMRGYGGPANSFLSSPLWQPLSKVSYGCYIWHVLMENINAGGTRTSTYFSNYQVILRFWGDFGMTVIVSVFFYLIFEAPLAGLESLLVPSDRKPAQKPDLPSNQKHELPATEKPIAFVEVQNPEESLAISNEHEAVRQSTAESSKAQ